ncbi:MAG: hypothetical protein JNG89_15050 [Planctomycetaceae bacterium]|nr:hypothetical protein [Planctomycetaceae bacterium]
MILQIALRLLAGISVTWCLMPRAAVTAGFFRIQMLVTLGLGVLATMSVSGDSDPKGVVRSLSIALACLSFAGSTLWSLGRRREGTVCCFLISATALTALLLSTQIPAATPAVRALGIASEISSAWLVGGSVAAMLLGHWHLTATSMSLVPLTRLTHLLLSAAALRGVLAGIGLWSVTGVTWSGVPLIWLVLRWSAGIIGPLVLGGMVLRILKYRNTQSATGVLFAAVILAFIGETTAALLCREFQWPL